MKARKLLLMPAVQALLVLTAAALTVLVVINLPSAGQAILLTPWIAAGLAGGWLGGRLFYPRWLRAGLAAALAQTALCGGLILSLEPRLLAAGTLLRLGGLCTAASLTGALFACGWRGAQKLRQAADSIAAADSVAAGK